MVVVTYEIVMNLEVSIADVGDDSTTEVWQSDSESTNASLLDTLSV